MHCNQAKLKKLSAKAHRMRPLFVRCSLFVRFIRCVFRFSGFVWCKSCKLLFLPITSYTCCTCAGKERQVPLWPQIKEKTARLMFRRGWRKSLVRKVFAVQAADGYFYVLWIMQCRILRCHAWSSKRLSMPIIPDTLSRVWMFVISVISYNDLTTLLALCLVRPQNSVCRMLYLSAVYSAKRSFRWFP